VPEVSRRKFLAGAAVAGVAAGLGLPGTAGARPAQVPVTREEHRVIVIGSGFGGGVTALRFAQAGIPVLVLERGVRWPTGPNSETFPSATRPDQRMFWLNSTLPFPRYTGLLESVPGNGMDITCAAGVGGGSLVYQGMTLQPAEAVFNLVLPAALDYRKMNSVYYPRVARMLGIATAPDELINSPTYAPARIFASHVEAAGYTVEKIPMPIDWSFALRELKGEMRPSYTNGDCAVGVRNGGKHSVDVTYLAQAEATGKATIAILHNVTDVFKAADGRWEVHVDRIATDGTVQEKKILTGKALVMAAGSPNTTRLLMRAKNTGTVPGLPPALGTGWGSNGDLIADWTNPNPAEDFGGTQGGPVVYGSKNWANPLLAETIVQASPPPGPDTRTTTIVGFGVSANRGRFTWDSTKNDAVLQWDKRGDVPLADRIRARMTKIAGEGSTITDTTTPAPSTWHPLGGAPMGTVCDLAGRVLGQRGLYVLDGALIPGSTGACNPSMTIAAIAERATDEILVRDAGPVF
jgi:cholesterol oxidase